MAPSAQVGQPAPGRAPGRPEGPFPISVALPGFGTGTVVLAGAPDDGLPAAEEVMLTGGAKWVPGADRFPWAHRGPFLSPVAFPGKLVLPSILFPNSLSSLFLPL